MKKLILLLLIINVSIVNSQNSWTKVTSKKTSSSKNSLSKSNEIALYSIDMISFQNKLKTEKEIILPNLSGTFSNYQLTEISNFTKKLASKYNNIKTYSIKGIEDRTVTGKLSIGTDGVNVILFSGKHKTTYINPFQKEKKIYAVHAKEILNEENNLTCLVKEDITNAKNTTQTTSNRTTNDSTLRTYRLALACTGEYAQFHINQQGISNTASNAVKKEAVLSAMNTTITRVNAVFERDLAVRLNIVIDSNGENNLIFLDAEEDNLTNDDPITLIEESQTVCDNIIGSNNYDIGHTFSTSGGGFAGIGVICSTNAKAKGITGSSFPIGDNFDINLVAHEIGHQFGAPHTFNGSDGGNCSDDQRSNSTSVEPGSGSTIMSYAGICPSINILNSSDDYFHAVSIANIQERIQLTSCPTQIDNQNTPPTINTLENVNVPKSTPLLLKGEAFDTESNNLTYCWEQTDNELVTVPLTTNTAGPAFRSFPPTSSPNRYLPTLETVLSGSLENEWESIPEVERELNFSLTVRDNQINGGATARENIVISVIDTAPFTVNTPDDLISNTNQTITWNTGETNTSPINANKVTIKLSVDGGLNFPFTIIEDTNNDGTENVLIPSVATTNNAIILIEADDNIFYNISNQFQITNNNEISLSNTTGDLTVCNNDEITYEVNYSPENGFAETVTFDVSNTPSNTNVSISPSNLNSNGTVFVTLSNLSDLSLGDYSFVLTASSSSIIQDESLNFQKISDFCESLGNISSTDQTSITQVDFATISNTSTRNSFGYSTFKDISAEVNIGESNDLSASINTDGNFSTQTRAWIDWNQNCTFDDSEQYDLGDANNVTNGITSNSPLTIIVPEDALVGNTVMRVITMSPSTNTVGSDFPVACQNTFFGETEDYTIIVNNPTAAIRDTTFNNFRLYPNPSQGIFNLNFEVFSISDNITINLTDITGKTIHRRAYNTTTNNFSEEINFSHLNTGLYLLQIFNGSKQTIKKIVIE